MISKLIPPRRLSLAARSAAQARDPGSMGHRLWLWLDYGIRLPSLTVRTLKIGAAYVGLGVSIEEIGDLTPQGHAWLQKRNARHGLPGLLRLLRTEGTLRTLSEVNLLHLSGIIFTELDELRQHGAGAGAEQLENLGRNLKRLVDASCRLLAQDHQFELRELQAARWALEDVQQIGAIARDPALEQPEKLQQVRRLLFGERPADLQPPQ